MKANFNGQSKKAELTESPTLSITNPIMAPLGVFQKRKYQHLHCLKANRHTNQHLQTSFNKYGSDSFLFEVLKVIDSKEERLAEEQTLLTAHWDNGRDCYNISKNANSRDGFKSKNPEHTREKLKGRKPWNKGKRGVYCEETLAAIRAAREQQVISEETKAKIAAASELRWADQEFKLRMKAIQLGEQNHFYGKSHSLEAKEKIGDANRGATRSKEFKQNVSESSKRRWQDPDYRERMKERHRQRWAEKKALAAISSP